MSDPAKTPEEIEDVLASIRRLVSDHTPGPDGSMQPSDADEEAPAASEAPKSEDGGERLVLTPSFRVNEPDDSWAPVAEQDAEETADATDSLVLNVLAQDAAAEEATDGPSGEWQPDDRMAEYDTVGPEGDAEEVSGEADAADNLQDDTDTLDDLESDAEDVADLILLDGAAPEAAEFESETGDENWPSDGAEAALLTLVARRDPAPAESAEAEEVENSNAADAHAENDEDTSETSDPGPDVAEVEATENMADAPDESEDEAVIEGETHDAASETEALDDETPDEGVSDEEAPADPPVTPVFSRKRPVPETVSEAEDAAATIEAEDLGEAPSPFTFPDTDEGILDEETLREIIVDVVREELQGVLGQRITRNVRKMVRREIRLALAAEDLD